MPRKRLIRQCFYPYHIVNRSNHKEWFSISMDRVWKIALNSLKHANDKYPVDIHAFVLMSNHYHLLMTTKNCDVDLFMYEFSKNFSLSLRKKSRKINRMFGGRYKWTIVQTQNYLWNVVKYIYLNPVAANIVKRCEDYPFSSLYYQSNDLIFPIDLMPLIEINSNVISWYNQEFSVAERNLLKKGLNKKELISLKMKKNRRDYVFTAP